MSYRWVRSEPLRIFIGWDSKETAAYHVLAHSIIDRASCRVEIIPLKQSTLRETGFYTRERGVTESTEFSLTRFLVPALCGYRGHAVFMDSDMLCQTDVNTLWDEILAKRNGGKPLLVCQHDYEPQEGVKFLGNRQTVYPRKNWSSLMVFDNTLCTALTPKYVNEATGLELHRFLWLEDKPIGDLPVDWNWLVGEYAPNPEARMLHYTLGGPWFRDHQSVDHADLWFAERDRMLGVRV
jgi:hypothetical protein